MKKISKALFNSLCYVKGSLISEISNEIEWYSSNNEQHLAAILHDKVDDDFSYVILERDSKKVYRCVDLGISFNNAFSARNELEQKFNNLKGESFRDFVKPQELYELVVKEEKVHPYFNTLLTDPRYEGAKNIIKEIVYANLDLDGNYIKDFQTSGFHGRLWETFLFALFKELNFDVIDEKDRPDFQIEKMGATIFVEAVTVNPSKNGKNQNNQQPQNDDEINNLNRNYMPIKFGSSLYSKLKKKYWELEHVQNKPLVIAIHDYHLGDSMTWSRNGLLNYLYGLEHFVDPQTKRAKTRYFKYHQYKSKKIASNFFNYQNAKHISAVLFTNSATLPKFNRMGKIAGLGSDEIKMIRIGGRYDPAPLALKAIPFSEEVIKGKYKEKWAEGVIMCHNPNALHPIERELFPNISHFYLNDDELVGYYVPYDVLFSKTIFG